MAAQPVIDTDYMNLEKESSYAFVSDMFEFNWIKRACNCYNANNLHEQIKFTLKSAWRVSVDQPDSYPTLFFWQPCHFVFS